MDMAQTVVWAAQLYGLCGAAVALAFAMAGPGRALPNAGHITPGGRLLIIPGAALLWPLVLVRWIGGR